MQGAAAKWGGALDLENDVLVSRCQRALDGTGMFNLEAVLSPEAAQAEALRLEPLFARESFRHARRHNIYFKPQVAGLAPDDPALAAFETSNDTLCADQLRDSPLTALYQSPKFLTFLAKVMQRKALFVMQDPLAAINVMRYGAGQGLNWHFDRAAFTVTLLLQAPHDGGVFEYRTGLRSDGAPNYAGVRKLLQGQDRNVQRLRVAPGTLNVFQGINTPHRVTPVIGDRARMIAVFTYFDRPGVRFSAEEQIGFYGRAAP